MNLKFLEFIVNVITGAPIWVWTILCYLLYVGIKATKTRVVYVPKLFIIPIILVILNYKTLIIGINIIPSIIFMLAGFTVGLISFNDDTVKDFKNTRSIEIAGNYLTIGILLLLFCIKYVFGYMQAMKPEIYEQYLILEISLCSMFSGYFLGRTFCFIRAYVK